MTAHDRKLDLVRPLARPPHQRRQDVPAPGPLAESTPHAPSAPAPRQRAALRLPSASDAGLRAFLVAGLEALAAADWTAAADALETVVRELRARAGAAVVPGLEAGRRERLSAAERAREGADR